MIKLCCEKAFLKNKNEIVEGKKRDTYVCHNCSKVIYVYDTTLGKNQNHSTR